MGRAVAWKNLFINRLIGKLDVHTREIVAKSSASLLVKVFSMAAGLFISVVLGRKLGPDGLGIVNLSQQVANIVLVLAMLGMDNVLRKETAIAFEKGDWHHVHNVIRTSGRVVLPIAAILSILTVGIAPYLSKSVFHKTELTVPLIIAVAVIVPSIYTRVYSTAINGFRKVWQSNLLTDSLANGLVAVAMATIAISNVGLTVVHAVGLYAISRVVVAVVVRVYWGRLFCHRFTKTNYQTRSMIRTALPLLLVASTTLIASNADVVMLGLMSDAAEVGRYSVASRLALMTSFFQALTVTSLAPKTAALYAQGRINELRTMVQRVTRGLGFVGLASLIFFAAFGKHFLSIWGISFEDAYSCLILLAVGQFVNIGTGATGIILVMTGNEMSISYITIGSVLMNIALNLLLIPKYGALGAACATAANLIVENIVKFLWVKLRLGISTIGLGQDRR